MFAIEQPTTADLHNFDSQLDNQPPSFNCHPATLQRLSLLQTMPYGPIPTSPAPSSKAKVHSLASPKKAPYKSNINNDSSASLQHEMSVSNLDNSATDFMVQECMFSGRPDTYVYGLDPTFIAQYRRASQRPGKIQIEGYNDETGCYTRNDPNH
ncbi:hypothetical protein MPSEU_000756300 [Mayamaea pseudoterrestris]|nr:hypothetical protein MPSEU_000756300 [Mayamaea pseudoterrestris]